MGFTQSTDSPLHGRALITGGTSGIGLSFARGLAARGCTLTLVARDEERLQRTCAQLERKAHVACDYLVADLGQAEDVQRVAAVLASADNPVEVFVNNAGHGLHHELATADTAPLAEAINVMASAVVELGAAAGAAMKGRGHGVIINTASVSGLVPMGLYSAIKSLVRTWSESLAIELAPTGVQVMTFMPGWVRTELHQRSGITTSNIPGFFWLDADRVVRECLRDVEAGRTHSTPSKRFKVIAALAAHAPRRAVTAVTARINRGRD